MKASLCGVQNRNHMFTSHSMIVGLHSNSNQQYNVQSADSWHQQLLPEEEVDANGIWNETNGPINRLNNDCLQEIFKYLDEFEQFEVIEVCQRFRDLVRRNSRCISLYISFRGETCTIATALNGNYLIYMGDKLARLRKSLICAGGSIQMLHVTFHPYHKPNYLNRLLYKMAQYVYGNIEMLSIANLMLTEEMLELLSPLLVRIKVF